MIADLPEHVGICRDTSHACNNGFNSADEARISGGRLSCLHLSDGEGHGRGDCHWIPGQGIIDWRAFNATLEEIGFAGPRIFEVLAEEGREDHVIQQAFAVAREWEQQ